MGSRDAWCTPKKITRRLPIVDLDPCSNPRSTVKARTKLMLETGDNGLLYSWRGLSVFVNPPYSDVLPWALKTVEAETFCFLVNVDPSTEWWRVLTSWGSNLFLFRDRIDFDAPPDIDDSSNNRPQCFICDDAFRSMLGNNFERLGKWWKGCV